ncbi:MAG: hypothetical protein H6558_10475 [Lewinellaceae bacterium]|nr:hypothetical protein [Lewinellaceae bacterium]
MAQKYWGERCGARGSEGRRGMGKGREGGGEGGGDRETGRVGTGYGVLSLFHSLCSHFQITSSLIRGCVSES